MKLFLLSFSFLFLSITSTNAQKIPLDYLVGTWTSIDSSGSFFTLNFRDLENVAVLYKGKNENCKYRIRLTDSLIFLTTTTNSNFKSESIIIPGKQGQLRLTTPEQYEIIKAAQKVASATVGWGWQKPILLTFNKVAAGR